MHTREMAFPAWSGLDMPAANCNVITPSFPEPLSEEQLVKKIEHAVEMLARQTLSAAQRILIIVEDSSRPSRTAPVIETLLRVIAPRLPNDVSFKMLFAGGAHYGLEEKNEFNKAPAKFPGPILTHNCLETSYYGDIDGKPVFLNREVDTADLRISIGTVNIHPVSGYTGGAKILVPGVAGLRTIFCLHELERGSPGEAVTPMRRFITNVLEGHPIELGLQLIANGKGEIVNLFVGPLQQAWDKAIEFLKPCVTRNIPELSNICIAEADPYDGNLLGIFKTLPVLIAAMTANGHGVILIRAMEGLGHHHWRLESEVVNREKQRWEEQLAERRVTVITEALLDAAAWKHIFPMQLQAVQPGEIKIAKNKKALVLKNAPLMLIKEKDSR
ncbi:MAG: lactate racemase domain-containing protein [Bacillota bacterium]|nr:lactate racemase domain-containing protein [Bacillota bacterium]